MRPPTRALALALLVSCHASPARSPRPAAPHGSGPAAPLAAAIEGAAPGLRGYPSIASKGDEHLVVWADPRRHLGAQDGPAEIVAVRLDASGAPVPGSQTSLGLAGRAHETLTPVALSCGESWLVLWSSARAFEPDDVYAVRLARDGKRIDAEPQRLTTSGRASNVAAACDEDSAFVAWIEPSRDDSKRGPVRATALSLGQPRLVAPPIDVSPIPQKFNAASSICLSPAVTFDGGGYLVGWIANEEGGDYPMRVLAARFSREGARLADYQPPKLAGSTTVTAPLTAVSAGDGHALLLWPDTMQNGKGYGRAALRFKDGALQDREPFLVDPTISFENTSTMRAAPDGKDGYLIAWRDDTNRIKGVRVGATGAPASPAGHLLSRGVTLPHRALHIGDIALTRAGGRHLAVWNEWTTTTQDRTVDIMAAGIDAAAMSAEPKREEAAAVRLSSSANAQIEVAIASRGSEHLAVWIDTREKRHRLYGAWLDPNGARRGEDFLISPAELSPCQAPGVVAGQRGYLVLWECVTQGDSGLVGLYLTPDERPAGATPTLLRRTMSGAGSYRAIHDGEGFVVAFPYAGLSHLRWPEGGAADRHRQEMGFPDPSPAYIRSPGLACEGSECLLLVGAVSGDRSWIVGGPLGDMKGKAILTLERNRYIGQVALTSGADGLSLAWVERARDESRLQLGSLRGDGTGLEPIAGGILPAGCCGPLVAAPTARGQAFFVPTHPRGAPAQVYTYRRQGDGMRGEPFLEATQIAVAESPRGALVAAWVRFDEEAGANRAFVGLVGDDLRAPRLERARTAPSP